MNNFIKIVAVLSNLIFTLCFSVFSQFSVPILPLSKTNSLSKKVPIHFLTSFNNDSLNSHYNEVAEKNVFTSTIFAKALTVDIDVLCEGKWDTLKNGNKILRLKIYSENANGFKLIFKKFNLPKGASLFFYDSKEENIYGAYTHLNNRIDGKFGTCRLPGNELIIEYNLPADTEDPGELLISQIGYIFTNAIHIGVSASCNIDANCLPYVNDWCNEIRAVVKIEPIVSISVSDTSGPDTVFTACSGVLTNNTNQNFDPLILTAKHAVAPSGNARPFPALWTVYYNFQADTCTDNTGNDKMTTMGVSILSSSSNSHVCPDLALLRVTDQLRWGYNIYFAGWNRKNRSNWPSDDIVCIHHPKGDLKKISEGKIVSQFDNCWKAKFSTGIVEKGSSGAPFFDEDHRIVGIQSQVELMCDEPDEKVLLGRINNAHEDGIDFDWYGFLGGGETLDGIDPIRSCQTHLDIVGHLYPGKDWQTKNQIIVQASQTIEVAANNVTTAIHQSPSNMSSIETADYIFRAGTSISMKAGFSVATNNRFSAQIVGCTIGQDGCGLNFEPVPNRPPHNQGLATTDLSADSKIPDREVKISPNPNNGNFEVFSLEENIKKVEILDATGKLVWERSVVGVDLKQLKISSFNLPAGCYYLRVVMEGALKTKSVIFIKQ